MQPEYWIAGETPAIRRETRNLKSEPEPETRNLKPVPELQSTVHTMNWQTLPTISTTRLTLRWIADEDVDAIFAIFTNPEVMRYWSTPPLANRAAAVALVEEIHDNVERQLMLKWGVARRSDNLVIGTTTLYNIDFNSRRAEIGYALGREHWGQGYMHEALQGLLAYCFEKLNFRRLEADVDPRNTASIQTLERLGFQREGNLRERWEVDGEIQDALFYGLLRREWKK